jgi:hypothetical protein
MSKRVYRKNDKHKRGTSGEGPPRWFPSRDSLCPDDLPMSVCRQLLEDPVDGADPAHPSAKALYAMHNGEFYKAYCEGTERDDVGEQVEVWHGYPVRRELVPRQVPSRVLREFMRRGQLTRAEYQALLGSAR